MNPTFTISVGGSDRTSVFQQRLLSLKLTETTGKEADTLELEFDDRDNAIALPAHGAVISLSIGYVGQALVDKGQFTVDETGGSGGGDEGDKITVSAKSADMRDSLKSQKSRAWKNMSTGDIVSQIAGENGLSAQVDPYLASIQVDHKDQTNESDLHFLTRHGRDHDAIASCKGGKLIFAPKGAATSASGQALAQLTYTRSDLEHWSWKNSDRAKYGSVRAKHRDMNAAALAYVTAGSGDPVKTLKHVHPSAGLAQDAASAEHRRGKRKSNGVTIGLQGDPKAFAGVGVVLSGVRDGINGSWIASKVEHEMDFDSNGYAMTIEATVDGMDPDSGDGVTGYGGDDADSGGDTSAEQGADPTDDEGAGGGGS